MKKIPLTQGKFAIVDNEDYELASRFKWHVSKQKHRLYAHCCMHIGTIGGIGQNSTMSLHRLIMRPPKDMDVDHIDHNALDCQRSNMRICTRAQNIRNSRKCQKHKMYSSYKGVSWNKRKMKWFAQICYNKKHIHLGYFNNEGDAAIAYNKKAKELFCEYAFLNNTKVSA